MAFGAMVALARRATEGGSWLVRISLAQCGKWIQDLGEVSETAARDAPAEFTPAELERWSMVTDTPSGKLRHLKPVVQLSETPPYLGAAIGTSGLSSAGLAAARVVI